MISPMNVLNHVDSCFSLVERDQLITLKFVGDGWSFQNSNIMLFLTYFRYSTDENLVRTYVCPGNWNEIVIHPLWHQDYHEFLIIAVRFLKLEHFGYLTIVR